MFLEDEDYYDNDFEFDDYAIKRLVHQTDKAFLFEHVSGKKFWVPKALVYHYDEDAGYVSIYYQFDVKYLEEVKDE